MTPPPPRRPAAVTEAPQSPTAGPRAPRQGLTAVVLGVASVGAGAVGALLGLNAAAVVLGLALLTLIVFRPVFAVYVYLGALPFLAGIDRDRLLPLVRPNEALLVLVLVAALIGAYLRLLRGAPIGLRLRPLDVPLFVFVLMSTLWPVVSLLLRGHLPTTGELVALLPICKLIGLFLLVRVTVNSDHEMLTLGRVVMWPAAAVASIAVLQTAGLPPVLDTLNLLWPTGGDPADVVERGTTTFASSIATGDYIVIALALLVALVARGLLRRTEQICLGLLLGAGLLASGQFSTWASAIVVGVVVLRQYPHVRRSLVRFLPLLGVAAVAGAPAFVTRLSQFGDGFGVPRSWLGRWDNLVNFYLPPLSDLQFVLGVSPDSVLMAPETWREVIYLEYGYLQLLWVGGIPLLAAFGWLSVALLRHCREQSVHPGVAGAYASALRAAWWMVLVLSLIDIHLVLRGTGELLFTFMAIVSGRTDDHRRR